LSTIRSEKKENRDQQKTNTFRTNNRHTCNSKKQKYTWMCYYKRNVLRWDRAKPFLL